MAARMAPSGLAQQITTLPATRMIHWLTATDNQTALLEHALADAVKTLQEKLGYDMTKWTYGRLHYALIKHPLSNAVNESTRTKLDVGPLPRGGYGFTPGMTTHNENQNAGASFRMVVDVSNWDQCMFTNAPGQSGDPASPFYKNLFQSWAEDRHFPVPFSRKAVNQIAKERLLLRPGN